MNLNNPQKIQPSYRNSIDEKQNPLASYNSPIEAPHKNLPSKMASIESKLLAPSNLPESLDTKIQQKTIQIKTFRQIPLQK